MTEENIHDGVVSIKPPGKSKRHFERGIPKEALTWNTAKQRSLRMFGWHCAVTKKFAGSARVVRVAWLLSLLCQKEGSAFATDAYISDTLGIPLNKVQQALTELERAGAIVRASSYVNGKPLRRIWPSIKIIPPASGGTDTPRDDRVDTPRRGGRDSIETTRACKTIRISTTAEAARRDAERREEQHSRQPEADHRGAPEAPQRRASAEGELIPDDGDESGGFRPPPDPSDFFQANAGARHGGRDI